MRSLVTVVASVLLAASLTGSTAPVSSREPRVLFFGDSLVRGTGLSPPSPVLPWVASRALGWSPVVDGIGGTGYTTGGRHGHDYAYRMAHESALRSTYDVVVLEGGTNDARHGALPRLQGAALAVVDRVRLTWPHATVVLLGVWAPPQVDQTRYRQADAVLRRVAAARGLTYVSQLGWTGPGLLARDGYHPSAAGYAALGRALAHAVDPHQPATVGAEGIEPPTTRL